MGKILGIAVAGLVAFGLGAGAIAAPQKVRVRGTITAINGNTIAVKSYNGHTVDLMLQPGTKFAALVRASLSDIKAGDFVGVGATGPEDHLTALEVLIFPASMRGVGEGHYGWSIPAAVARADRPGTATAVEAPIVQGTMTNGTVAAAAPQAEAPPVRGTMTNGTVAAGTGSASGTELTIAYDHGNKVRILVPPDAPVVRLLPARRSVVVPNAKAFVVATQSGDKSGLSAGFVAVGEHGLTPPM
ncbi:MAG TPA: hypothetical protein VE993_16220 [Stellaceae bacterium]|nr:hypothetical protein [Stellaceae bacterium]